MKLAVNAAMPATNPPTTAVIKINAIYEPPSGSSRATLVDNMWWLLISIIVACIPHKRNKARKADVNAFNGSCGINAETMKAAGAMIHQLKYRLAAKLSNAVSNRQLINFILIILSF